MVSPICCQTTKDKSEYLVSKIKNKMVINFTSFVGVRIFFKKTKLFEFDLLHMCMELHENPILSTLIASKIILYDDNFDT